MNIFKEEDCSVVNLKLAKLLGLEKSLILCELHYLILMNAKNKKDFKNGYYWVHATFDYLQEHYFYIWSTRKLMKNMKELIEKGLIIGDTLNEDPFDKTKWYRINYQKIKELKLL